MRHNSRKCGGYTLIEVIISIAIVGIISVGVYDGYMIIIKQTKGGQVKQTSTLIGNQVSEQIKEVSEKKIFTTTGSGEDLVVELTNDIHLKKEEKENGDTFYGSTLYFDEKGKSVSSTDNYRYKVNIELKHQKLIGKDTPIVIEEVLDENTSNGDIENRNICLIQEKDQSAKVIDKDEFGSINSLTIENDKIIEIDINANDINAIKVGVNGQEKLPYDINDTKKQQITMDLQYCTGKIIVEVNNETRIPLNLFILNGNNVEVNNNKGILHEYRRSEVGSKIGTLYDVNIKIFDDKSVDGFKTKHIFETSFVQNINIE